MPNPTPPHDSFARRLAVRAASHNGPLRLAPFVLARALADTVLRRPFPISNAASPVREGQRPSFYRQPPHSAEAEGEAQGERLGASPARLNGWQSAVSPVRVAAVVIVGCAAVWTGLGPVVDEVSLGLEASGAHTSAHMPDTSYAASLMAPSVTGSDAAYGFDSSAVDGGARTRLRALPPLPPGLPVGAPVAGPVSSPFGLRIHPVTGRLRTHAGTDFAVPTSTPVRATADGRVQSSGRRSGYGLAIEIRHRDPSGFVTRTLYAHLSSSAVLPGSPVRRGEVVGWSGGGRPGDGLSTGPHLHYEVRAGARSVDPRSLYPRLRTWRAEASRRRGLARRLARTAPVPRADSLTSAAPLR